MEGIVSVHWKSPETVNNLVPTVLLMPDRDTKNPIFPLKETTTYWKYSWFQFLVQEMYESSSKQYYIEEQGNY